MKLMLMTLAMVITVALNAQPRGQRGGNPTEQAKKQTEKMTAALELDAKQAKKVQEINLKYAKIQKERRDAMHKSNEAGQDIDHEAVKEEMKDMRAAQEEDIKSVLTPAQITKFDAMKEERQGKKGDSKTKKKGKKGKKAKGEKATKAAKGAKADVSARAKKQAERMATQLELTAEQTKKVEAINLKYAQKTQELRQASKTAEAKPDKAAMKEIRQAQDAEIKSVLTPAQVEKLEAIKAERKEKKGKKGKKGKKSNSSLEESEN